MERKEWVDKSVDSLGLLSHLNAAAHLVVICSTICLTLGIFQNAPSHFLPSSLLYNPL